MGRYGYGEQNERGERLLEFAVKHKLMIGNTRFQQKESRKWTWRSPSGLHKNMIDLILIEQRWKTALWNCRTYQGADISSDHSLVMAKIQVRLKGKRQRNMTVKRDISALKQEQIRQDFMNRTAALLQENRNEKDATTEERANRLKNCLTTAMEDTLPQLRKPRRPYITSKTLELSDKKRALKMQRQESEAKSREYKELCNRVRQAAREDKEKWLQERCGEIQNAHEQGKSRKTYQLIKEINGDWKPRQRAMKNKEGKLLQESEEIKERWTEYCRELYEKDQETEQREKVKMELKEITPETEDRRQPLLRDEVHRAITRSKHHKSPGTDGIVVEVIQAGGEEVEKEIYEIMTKIWEEETLPEDWTSSIIVTIFKKGDSKECSNYRTISLINHIGKILLNIIQNRLQTQIEPFLSESQAGFRKDRSTIQQILILRLIAEKAWRKNTIIYNCFIDFSKAFDTINQELIWAVLDSYGVDKKVSSMLQQIYKQSRAAVRVGQELGEWFEQRVGTRQGDPVSPVIFITYLERAMDKNEVNRKGITISGETIDDLRFADDIDLLEENIDNLQESLDKTAKAASEMDLVVNIAKTKVMVFGRETAEKNITLNEIEIENVNEFIYLGSLLTWDNNCSKEIKRRIARAMGTLGGFNKVWSSREIRLGVKLNILKTCVFSTLLYAAETWTIKKEDKDRLLSFEMKCYRRILRIRWQQKITNVEVRRRMKVTTNVMQEVIKRKMTMFGHICRMTRDRRVKKVMEGFMEGNNRRGRPRREWLQDIEAWGGKNVPTLMREAQDRNRWRIIVMHAVDTNGWKPMDLE
jgi:hypothetical protein